MGILAGALGGMGEAMANIGATNQKADLARENELAVGQQRSDLELQRQQTLMKFQEEMRNAPLNRLGAKAREFAGQDVPMDAPRVAPVTQTGGILSRSTMTGNDGQPIQGQGGGDVGLSTSVSGGSQSIAEMKANVLNNPNISAEDKKGIVAQLDSQAAQANTANQELANASVAGQTRKRTSSEALSMAADDAKVNDPSAYADYQARIGKPERDDRRLDIADTRAQTQDEFNRGRLERLDRLDEIRTSAAEARAKRAEGAQATSMDKAELQSQRQSVTSLMTSTEKELERNQALAEKDMDPASKKMYQDRVERLTRDLSRYRSALESFGGDSMPAQEPPAKPTPTQAALDFLKNNPSAKADFVAKYGADALPKETQAQPKTPAEPVKSTYVKPPSIEETIAQGRARDVQTKAAREQITNDPRIADLKSKQSTALRKGKVIEANGYLQQIKDIEKSYGL